MDVIHFGRQCDTLQESCCMTIVMDNFVECLDAHFFALSLVFSDSGMSQQLRNVNKTGQKQRKKKCIHHLMQFTHVTGDSSQTV